MADSIQRSIESIHYCYFETERAGFREGDTSDEDVAHHLISFSLSKIIAAMTGIGVRPNSRVGDGTDTGLRYSLRRFQQDNDPASLLAYLLLARRVGLNVIQIDDHAWLSALDFFVDHHFGIRITDILLFGEPTDFVAKRNRIMTRYPDSDILVDALDD